MKRILTIALLSLFLFNIIGYYFLFIIAESTNRSEIQSAIKQQISLETIRVHKSELSTIIFKDGGKEIYLSGEMYDIKSTSFEGEFILFHCKHDKKETKLLAGLDKHVKNNTDSKIPHKKQNDKNPVKDLFFHKNAMTYSLSITLEFSSVIFNFTSYIAPPLPLPPPEVSFS